jgi:hypothetical protein
MEFLSDIVFKVVAVVGLFSFMLYGETKRNKIQFRVVNFIILLLWVTAWHFFVQPVSPVSLMIGELLIFLSFCFLFLVFSNITKSEQYQELKIFILFSAYPILILLHKKEDVIIVSTSFFILMQFIFKLLTIQKIKELRLRKRLERFYIMFLLLASIDDILSFLFIMDLISRPQLDYVFIFWNLIMTLIVINGIYLMTKIKAVR